MTKKIEIINDEKNPQPDQIIAQSIIDFAQSIIDFSEGVSKLMNGRLTREAILLLLVKKSGVGAKEIGKVLDAIPRLKEYVK